MASISLMGKLGPGTSHHLPSRWGCQLLWVHVRSTYAGGSVYEGLGSSFRGLERGSLLCGGRTQTAHTFLLLKGRKVCHGDLSLPHSCFPPPPRPMSPSRTLRS